MFSSGNSTMGPVSSFLTQQRIATVTPHLTSRWLLKVKNAYLRAGWLLCSPAASPGVGRWTDSLLYGGCRCLCDAQHMAQHVPGSGCPQQHRKCPELAQLAVLLELYWQGYLALRFPSFANIVWISWGPAFTKATEMLWSRPFCKTCISVHQKALFWEEKEENSN